MSYARRDETLHFINKFRKENDENESLGSAGCIFARVCMHCRRVVTGDRYASLACGHNFCRECVDRMDAACAICKQSTTFVKLFEVDEQHLRQCSICLCEAPLRRQLFPCGHTTCTACTLQTFLDAKEKSAAPACPYCRFTFTSFPPLLRELRVNPVKRSSESSGCPGEPIKKVRKIEVEDSCEIESDEGDVSTGDAIASVTGRDHFSTIECK